MNKQLLSTTGLILAVILFMSFIIVVNDNLKSARVDLTEDQLYTLSEGTINIIERVQEPITLRLYYSETPAQALPAIKSYAQRVTELLEEYERVSNGKIRLKIINPRPYSDHEQRAEQYGLQKIPIEGEPDPLYFGLAGSNQLDGLEIIKFFQPEKEDTLEYDLTKLIHQLSDAKRKTVGMLSPLPVDGEEYDPLQGEVSATGQEPWKVMEQLRQLYDVTPLPADVRRIPASLDALIVIHPKELSDTTMYAIEQYVLKGGKLVSFVDPFAEIDQPKEDPDNPMSARMASRSSNMKALFEAWGFERNPSDVVADRDTAMKVDFGRAEPVDYVLWQRVGNDQMNPDSAITRNLARINTATPGYFEQLDGAETTFKPLFSSTSGAMRVHKRVVQFRNDPVGLLTRYEAGTISYPYAVRVQGRVKSAFPNGAKNIQGETVKMPDHVDAADNIDVIAVADVDMLNDRYWVSTQNFQGEELAFKTSNNIDFLNNSIESLTGTEGLISVRSRTGFSRPFELVNDIERAAERRYRAKERELEQRLQETEQKIARMQTQRSGSEAVLTPEQQKEISEARILADKTELELRQVKGKLREDIEQLETTVKFLNIGAVPILLTMIALVAGWLRIRKRDRARFRP